MKTLILAVCVATGCTERAAPPPPAAPPSAAGPSAALAVTEAAPDPWVRTVPSEPDPQARALYRRGLQRLYAGDAAEAEALFKQVASTWPASRFGQRLNTAGLPENLLVSAAASTVGLLAFAVYAGLVDRRNEP